MDSSVPRSPAVTVIMPVYNCRDLLDDSFRSLAAQTFRSFEVICVDDGSSDGSRDKLEELRAAGTVPELTVLSSSHQGPGVARNLALDAARGEYVCFLDADDFIEPDTLEVALGRARALDADIVVWDAWYFNDVRKRDQHPPVGTLLFHEYVPIEEQETRAFRPLDRPDFVFTAFQNWPWNKLFRRSFIEEHHLRFPPLFRTEDLPFTCSALILAERVALVYRRLTHYRICRAGSSMQRKDSHEFDFIEAFLMLRRELEERGLWDTVFISYTDWALGSTIYNLNSLKTIAAFRRVFTELRAHYLKELGVLDRDVASYRSDFDRMSLEHLLADDEQSYLLWRTGVLEWMLDDQRATIDELDEARVAEHGRAEALVGELDAARRDVDRVACERDEERRRREAVEGSRDYRWGKGLLRVPRAIKRRLG